MKLATRVLVRPSAANFFVGLTLLYFALSPLSIRGMGYASENAAAAEGLISTFGGLLRDGSSETPITWPRHGLLEPSLQVPFLLVARLFPPAVRPSGETVLSLEPLLASSLLCTIVFVWVRRITTSHVWGVVFSLTAGLATMIWPYAYIGLETTQALCLALTAYLALGDERPATWPHLLLTSLTAGIAVSVKANGTLLLPAVAFLLAVYFRRRMRLVEIRPTMVLVAVVIIVSIYAANTYSRQRSPIWAVGVQATFQLIGVGGIGSFGLNVLSLLTSLNKGLLIYSPIVLLALGTLPRAWTVDRAVATFALLTLGGLITGSALVLVWSEETWGPRYLHTAVAPLIICAALTRRNRPFRLRTEVPLAALVLAGAIVSGLGALFYYGSLHAAAKATGVATLETLQFDPAWNPIRFHAALFRQWAAGDSTGADSIAWPPPRHRWFPEAGESFVLPAPISVDLRRFATPQPLLFSVDPFRMTDRRWWACAAAGVCGVLMLMVVALGARNRDAQGRQIAAPTDWLQSP